MAIDDLRLENGACQAYGSCSFEDSDYCTWQNVDDKRDQFDWEFGSDKTATLLTGPS